MAVTMQAVSILPGGTGTHPANNTLVAADAFTLDNIFVETFYLQRFREISCSKGNTVVPAINCFYCVFTKKIVRCVAVIAGCRRVMARAGPGIKMLSHDVAVFACDRIILQVRSALRVIKSVSG